MPARARRASGAGDWGTFARRRPRSSAGGRGNSCAKRRGRRPRATRAGPRRRRTPSRTRRVTSLRGLRPRMADQAGHPRSRSRSLWLWPGGSRRLRRGCHAPPGSPTPTRASCLAGRLFPGCRVHQPPAFRLPCRPISSRPNSKRDYPLHRPKWRSTRGWTSLVSSTCLLRPGLN
ncbi:hypothetical protein DFJ74DRAFT_675085 [Hyaloraphidium curvatum]|nr:hypothetical protein DFJ74DRAFT_675085 [Hyaloraphidium curvatum]